VADDEQQRRLEAVKLRIDVLKHVTTLSGAATVVLLALADRVTGTQASRDLGYAAFYFGLSTLSALSLMTILLRNIDRTETIPRRQGQRGTELVIVLFGSGVLALMTVGARFAPPLSVTGMIILVIGLIIGVVIYGYRQRKRKNDSDKTDDEEPEEPRSDTPTPTDASEAPQRTAERPWWRRMFGT
jgi:hypothetical protein